MDKQIAFVVYDGLTPLDLVGPLQVLSVVQRFAPDVRVTVVGETLDVLGTDTPLKIAPERTFADTPQPFAVIVPGGEAPTLRAMYHEPIQSYLRDVAPRAELIGSVCTGALILAAAGLLEGRKATTHWAYASLLGKFGATYVRQRWVEDGPVITAAGVSAGIDMGLHLAARFTNDDVARVVQLGIEYDPQPPLGPMAWDLATPEVASAALSAGLRRAFSDRPDLLESLMA